MADSVRIVVDGRDLQPPEPLEQTMAALDRMPPDGEVLLLVYCRPQPLFNILRRNNFCWVESVNADGCNEILIRRA
jgi:hypothetical protein